MIALMKKSHVNLASINLIFQRVVNKFNERTTYRLWFFCAQHFLIKTLRFCENLLGPSLFFGTQILTLVMGCNFRDPRKRLNREKGVLVTLSSEVRTKKGSVCTCQNVCFRMINLFHKTIPFTDRRSHSLEMNQCFLPRFTAWHN